MRDEHERNYFRFRWEKHNGIQADGGGLGVLAVLAIAVVLIFVLLAGTSTLMRHVSFFEVSGRPHIGSTPLSEGNAVKL
jgi:hypothetical protein